ncbi:ATP-binding cassette domain-containing protein [Streptomyces sp. NPDC005012]|uniref:ABC transporter ATP-binding protein n=1 Tax=Streptomyces sp. NPDC005012 TaxID=3154558 RepID=UPI0033BFB1A6
MSRQGDGPPPATGVAARGLGVKGPRGWAFRGVAFEAEPGSLVAVTGPSGSGRTALLLALTGRMRPTEGTAEVAGRVLPKRMAEVRRVTGVANVPGVTDLDPALTVAEHLRERVLVGRRYGGTAADLLRGLLRPPRVRAAADAARVRAALEDVGLGLADLPKGGRTAVRDLSREQELRLSVALALLGRPDRPAVVAVDDADLGLTASERAAATAMFSALTARGVTVLAACREVLPEADVVVRTDVRETASAEDGAAGGGPAGEGECPKPGGQAGPTERNERAGQDGQARKAEPAGRTERAEKTGRTKKARQGERAETERAEQARKAEQAMQSELAGRTEQGERTKKAKRTERAGQSERAGQGERAEAERAGQAEQAGQAGRAEQAEQAGRGEETGRGGRAAAGADGGARSGRPAGRAERDTDTERAREGRSGEEEADAHATTGRA